MMLWVLGLLLTNVVFSATTPMHSPQEDRRSGVTVTTRPLIYYCRSPNMEVFTCWWHPLNSTAEGDGNVTYTLTYSMEKGPREECPDYVTGGPNSCHFDSSHTSVWLLYCMEVTAQTAQRNYTSQEHCLDVAEIVETEAPVNLTYTVPDDGEENTVVVSWVYPSPSHIQFGWITLVFELQYRRVDEPNNWKVKGLLREPHLELLDLPVGEYVVQVRCRSRNYGLWSRWSSPLLLAVPGNPTPDKLLALILMTGVGVLALLIVGFGALPHGKRIRAFLLPPVPKPRISGINPLLLKHGKMEEIDRHFLSLHGYRPPSYSEEQWDRVSMDYSQSLHGNQHLPEGEGRVTSAPPAAAAENRPPSSPAPYQPGPAPPYHSLPAARAWPRESPAPQVKLLSFPGSDYSLVVNPALPAAAAVLPRVLAPAAPQDFYTCVNGMSESGGVQLVPCLCSAVKHSPYTQLKEELGAEAGKSSQLGDRLAREPEAVGQE